jgi:hypothetical protein
MTRPPALVARSATDSTPHDMWPSTTREERAQGRRLPLANPMADPSGNRAFIDALRRLGVTRCARVNGGGLIHLTRYFEPLYGLLDQARADIIPNLDRSRYHGRLAKIDFVAAAQTYGWAGGVSVERLNYWIVAPQSGGTGVCELECFPFEFVFDDMLRTHLRMQESRREEPRVDVCRDHRRALVLWWSRV